MQKIRNKKKHHFQLLEVMIAIFLVATCVLPVLGTYVHIYSQQRTMGQMIETNHFVHAIHAKITQDLYLIGARGDSLKVLLDKEHRVFENKSDANMDMDPFWRELEKKPYEFFYKLKIQQPTQSKAIAKANKLLLQLEIYTKFKKDLKPTGAKNYLYDIYVERFYKEGQNEFES